MATSKKSFNNFKQNIDKLREIYYNPKTGLSSINNLIMNARKAGITSSDLSDIAIRTWVAGETIHQTKALPAKAAKNYSIPFRDNGVGNINADLLDMSNYAQQNDGNKFIFVAIDVYSRYGWAYSIKSRKAEDVLPAVEYVFNELNKQKAKAQATEGTSVLHSIPFTDFSLTTDSGVEFMGPVAKYCRENNIKRYYGSPYGSTEGTGKLLLPSTQNRTNLVERFNRTLLGLITSYIESRGNRRYIDALQDLVENYNNNINRGIGQIPALVYAGVSKPNKRRYPGDNFEPGTEVRLLKSFSKFQKKSRENQYSDAVYKIESKREGARYKLDNGMFYLPSQFKVVPQGSVNNERPAGLQNMRETTEEIRKNNTFERRMRKEGIEPAKSEPLQPRKRFTGKYSK